MKSLLSHLCPPRGNAPAPLASLVLAGLLAACATAQPGPGPEPVPCPAAQAALAPSAPAKASGEPDFALYGFPRVAATYRFTPGRKGTISAEGIVVTLPPDLYTEPLEFELLLGQAASWQPCAPSDQVVLAPYAYRAVDPATGDRVGRFDKPAVAAISDPRMADPVTFWYTFPTNPPMAQPEPNRPAVEGNSIKVTNPTARRGWFVTVPRR